MADIILTGNIVVLRKHIFSTIIILAMRLYILSYAD